MAWIEGRTLLPICGIATVAIATVTLGGCGTAPTARTSGSNETNSSLNALASDSGEKGAAAREEREPSAGAGYKPGTKLSENELAALAAESAVDMERVFAERNTPKAAPAAKPVPAQEQKSPMSKVETGRATEPGEPAVDAAPEVEPAPVAPAPAVTTPVPEDPQARMNQLASELSTLLQKRMVSSPDPVPDVLALAAIEALKPDSSAALPEGVDKALSPPELKAVTAVRDLIRGLVGDPATARDPGKAADRVMEVLKQLSQSRPLSISRSALCSKVTGFGQYVPLGGSAFLAGGGQKAIIYTEVDGFTHRDEVREGEPMWGVELSQEAALFHAGDNTLQWRWPEQQVRELSRNKRRDFFVIRQIELPRNLSVGQYVLKVTVRDKVEGKAVAQTSLPVLIVADPTLVTAK